MAKTIFDDTPPQGTIVTAAFLNAIQNHRHDGANADGSCPIEYAVAGGSNNAFTLALNPALLNHTAGLIIRFKANHSINGAATVNIDGLGAIAIKKQVSTNLITGDIVNGQIITIVYDGTYYQAIGLPVIAPGAALQDMGTNSGGTGAEWYNGVRQLLNSKGAMVYASGANALAKLAIGAVNKGLFVNAAGELPEWGYSCSLVPYYRDNLSNGDVSYTGAGFKPRIVINFSWDSSHYRDMIGVSDGTNKYCMNYHDSSASSTSSYFIFGKAAGNGDRQDAIIKTLDSDGMTLTWTKTNSGCSLSGLFLYLR